MAAITPITMPAIAPPERELLPEEAVLDGEVGAKETLGAVGAVGFKVGPALEGAGVLPFLVVGANDGKGVGFGVG